MKKLFIYSILLIGISSFSQGTLNKGRTQLNVGLGFSDWGTPVFVGLDYGLGNNWTLGGEVSYRSFGNDNFLYDYKYTVIGIGANGNYHFNEILDLPREWDLYGGGTIGFLIWNNSYKYNGPGDEPAGFNPTYSNTSGLGFGLQAGARYFFNDKWAVHLETGGGSVFGGKIGVTYKFGGGSSKKSSKSSSSTSSKSETSKSTSNGSASSSSTSTNKSTTTAPATTTTTKPKTTATTTKPKTTTKKKK
jgi:outer membrane immunogenic protein